jgi:phosphate-selective porin OprO and OprP
MFASNSLSSRSLAIMSLTVALAPRLALAQSDTTTHAQSTGAPGVTVKWNNGIDVATTDGANEFQVGGLVQVDGRFTTDDPLHAVTDTLVLRRIRPIFQGRAGKYFEFRLMPDFGNGATVLFDAYFDTKLSTSFRIRVGKDKTPVGLEQLYSDYAVLFPERSLLTNLVPNRDIGIQAIGDLGGGVLSYIGAVFNGVPDAANADVDTNSGKDLAGRLTLRPFARTSIAALRGAGVAVGGTSGRQTGALPSFKSTAQQTFFAYASTATANGVRTRVSPAAFYYYKSLGAFAEYARTTQAVNDAKAADDITNTAWEVTGSFVLTGEAANERGVVPRRPFDPAQGHWGALQLIVRHSRLAVDPLAFADGFASANASRTASATGIGASLYANSSVKYVLTFERTVFDDNPNASRRPEHALVFRLQFNLQPSL